MSEQTVRNIECVIGVYQKGESNPRLLLVGREGITLEEVNAMSRALGLWALEPFKPLLAGARASYERDPEIILTAIPRPGLLNMISALGIDLAPEGEPTETALESLKILEEETKIRIIDPGRVA